MWRLGATGACPIPHDVYCLLDYSTIRDGRRASRYGLSDCIHLNAKTSSWSLLVDAFLSVIAISSALPSFPLHWTSGMWYHTHISSDTHPGCRNLTVIGKGKGHRPLSVFVWNNRYALSNQAYVKMKAEFHFREGKKDALRPIRFCLGYTTSC